MHPYDQMLSVEWEQRCAEEGAPFLCERCGVEIRGGINALGDDDMYCLDCQTLADEKAQERRLA